MTKEITKAIILQEIEDKCKLREYEPSKFLFSEEVVPVYDIGPHFKKREVETVDVSITSAASFLLFAVPENERWSIQAYNLIPMGAGAFTMAGVFLQRGSSGSGYYIYMDLTAGQTDSYLVVNEPPVIADPGNRIEVTIDGYTSTQTLRAKLAVEKETIR